MSVVTMLRLAAVLAAIQGTAHGALIALYKPKNGPAEVAVIEAMRSHFFNFGGASRSYWQLYFGYALFTAFSCLVEAAVFWQLAAIAAKDAALVRPLVGVFIAANVVHALIAGRYFFATPIVFDALVALCLSAALLARAG